MTILTDPKQIERVRAESPHVKAGRWVAERPEDEYKRILGGGDAGSGTTGDVEPGSGDSGS